MSGGPKIPPVKGLIDGPLYEAAYYGTRYQNVPPNMHRLRNAVGLTIGLYMGRKLMDIVAGETIDGKKIDRKDVPTTLRPLYRLLPYDHFSDKPHDRWMKVFDMMVPGVLGGIGAAAGSVSFFKEPFFKPVEAHMHLPAEKLTLPDLDRRALHHISKPWSVLSGTSAVFGSASGFGLFPSPVNYSSTLGTTFTLRAERTMTNPVMREWFNSHSYHPFRPTKLIGQMIEYAAGNPSANPRELDSYARGIIKSWFKNVDEKHIKAFADEVLRQRNVFLENGHLPEHAEAKVKEALKKTLGDLGIEKTFIRLGLDPREAAIGDVGFISSVAHFFGDLFGMETTKHMEETREMLRKGLEARHPELKNIPFIPKPPRYSDSPIKKAATARFVTAGALTLGVIATAKDASMEDMDSSFLTHAPSPVSSKKSENNNGSEPPAETPAGNAGEKTEKPLSPAAPSHKVHSKKHHNIINGHVLDTAEGITGMLSGGIGIHRIYCALGLTAGSWLGDKVMEAMTGISFHGVKVREQDVLKPLRKLYRILPFNPKSDLPHDKWMQILRWAVPAVIGGFAVTEGSRMFFTERHKKTDKARYLDEVEEKADMAQSDKWSYTSAISAVMGYPSGLSMLPLLNYSTNLGTRWSMGSGRKVALPVVGKYWSNNSTLFPFGPPGMIELIIKTAINNTSYDPELLETYAIGVLKPWFKNVTPEQIESFVLKVHEIRDKFFKEGGVPEDMKKQLESELKAHFKGAGLEDTLREIGLDPLQADIGSNGISGHIANFMGAAKNIEKIKSDYAQSYRERLKKDRTDPPTTPTLST